MVKKNCLPWIFAKPVISLIALFLMAFTTNAIAQSSTDTTKKILLASVNFTKAPRYMLKECNVIFPDILKGNEEQATEYIAAFSNKKRHYLVRMYTKGKKILPKAKAILKKYNLPEELSTLMTTSCIN